MKKKWKKPLIQKVAVKQITLSGSAGNTETKGNTGISKKNPALP